MVKIKSVGAFSLAKFLGLLAAFAGLAYGMVSAIGGLFFDLFFMGLNKGTGMAFLSIIIKPIYFGIYGYIAGFVVAPMYNYFAKRFEGIDLEIEYETPE